MDPRRLHRIEYYNDSAVLTQYAAPPSRVFRHSSDSSSQPTRLTRSGAIEHNHKGKQILSEKELRIALQSMLIKVHEGHWKEFIPRSDIKAIITTTVIAETIKNTNGRQKVNSGEVQQTAETLHKCARSLFTILTWLEKSGEILNICETGIADENLPLTVHIGNGRGSVRSKQGQIIDAFKDWDPFALRELNRFQWSVTAPVFKLQPKGSPCVKFPDKTVPPFIPINQEENTEESAPNNKIGGYSEVSAYRIHPAHHNFWEKKTPAVRTTHIA